MLSSVCKNFEPRKKHHSAGLAILALSLLTAQGEAGNVAPGHTRVISAVALVQSPQQGTAFAVQSRRGYTIFVTAAHVIGCTKEGLNCSDQAGLYLNGDNKFEHRARVLSHGSVNSDDIAIIALGEGPLPVVHLADHAVYLGERIGVLGYPSYTVVARSGMSEAQVDVTLDIGSVSSAQGARLWFTGHNHEGESGGPIFDAQSGDVVGVLHGRSESNLLSMGVSVAAINNLLNSAVVRGNIPSGAKDMFQPERFAGNLRQCWGIFDGPNRADCFKFFADTGDEYARFEYAWLLLEGVSENGFNVNITSVRRDIPEGLRNLRQAGDASQTDAERFLGQIYLHGMFGVIDDRAMGRFWYTRAYEGALAAANKGDAHAIWLLAKLYGNGDLIESGVLQTEPDLAGVHALLLRCANLKEPLCANDLAEDFLFSRGDASSAAHWYEVGAQEGDKEAALKLADAYRRGIGVAANRENAIKWYQAALPIVEAKLALQEIQGP